MQIVAFLWTSLIFYENRWFSMDFLIFYENRRFSMKTVDFLRTNRRFSIIWIPQWGPGLPFWIPDCPSGSSNCPSGSLIAFLRVAQKPAGQNRQFSVREGGWPKWPVGPGRGFHFFYAKPPSTQKRKRALRANNFEMHPKTHVLFHLP